MFSSENTTTTTRIFPAGAKDSSAPSPGSLIGEERFSVQFAATEFAAHLGMLLDTSVTITWRLLGVETEHAMVATFAAFLKCLRDWLLNRHISVAYTFSHEVGAVVGHHTHLAVWIPEDCSLRSEFRHWAQNWVRRRVGARAPRALRVRGPSVATPWLHWLAFSYQMKGYDKDAVVCSGRNAPNGRDVSLGDLIAFRWRDPGCFEMKTRTGFARGLGPSARLLGVHEDDALHHDLGVVEPFGRKRSYPLVKRPSNPFRSSYEDGARDVWALYGDDFSERVTKLLTPSSIAVPAANLDFDQILENLDR